MNKYILLISLFCLPSMDGYANGIYTAGFFKRQNSKDLGTGQDGTFTVTAAGTVVNSYAHLTSSASVGAQTIYVNTLTGFAVGDQVMVVAMQNCGGATGQYEFATIQSTGTSPSSYLTFSTTLTKSYPSGTFASTCSYASQVVKVRQYDSLTINAGASITSIAWNGYSGGLVVFRVKGTFTNSGSVNVSAQGFRGPTALGGQGGRQGESPKGMGAVSTAASTGGGGGGSSTGYVCFTSVGVGSGGGGGYGTAGGNGVAGSTSGTGGGTYGTSDGTTINLGSGGGAGGSGYPAGYVVAYGSGTGAGAILIFARTVGGTILAQGGGGGGGYLGDCYDAAPGGAGSGGMIMVRSQTTPSISSSWVNGGASAGSNVVGHTSGAGGSGRIVLLGLQ